MEKLHHKADQQREDYADHAACTGQRHGFHNELEADIPATRANGFTDSDLSRSLGHRHQHDVHHAYSTHQQSNRHNGNQQHQHLAENVSELVAYGFGGAQAEIIRLIRGHAAAHSQDTANLIFGLHLHSLLCLHHDEIFVILRVMFAVAAVRYVDAIVESGIEGPALFFLIHTNHGVRSPCYQDLFIESGFSRKERFSHVSPDHRHIGAVQVFALGEEASIGNAQHIDFSHAAGGPIKINAAELVVLVTGRAWCTGPLPGTGEDFNTHIVHRRRVFFDRHGVFIGERLTLALFRTHSAYVEVEAEAEDPQIVGAELIE